MKRITLILIYSVYNAICFAQYTSVEVKVSTQEKRLSLLKTMNMISIKNKSYKLRPSYPYAKTPELLRYYEVILDNDNVDEMITELEETGYFESVKVPEAVYAASLCVFPVPFTNDEKIVNGTIDNYALELINARCAWAITKGKPTVTIGIADSDFELTHEDLQNQIVQVSGIVSAGHYHGTCVAGVAAAETNNGKGISGVGYNSKIAAYRVIHRIDSDVPFAPSTLIKDAIWAAYLDGQRIINVSWEDTGLAALAAKEITENGTTLVLAAGNTVNSTSHSSIANIPGVIVVSGVDRDNNFPGTLARNQYVDLCAPGVKVALTAPGSTYWTATGTSYSAPLVSGVVALMSSLNPCLTPAEIETILKNTTEPINNASLYPGLIGTGRLDAYNALVEVLRLGTNYIQNKTYTSVSPQIEYATTVLKAGNSVNSTLSVGNVVLNAGSNVAFKATHGIELSPGFEIKNGATFSAEIVSPDCQ